MCTLILMCPIIQCRVLKCNIANKLQNLHSDFEGNIFFILHLSGSGSCVSLWRHPPIVSRLELWVIGIFRWLSGSDLRKVAFFGCPSTARKDVFAAKRLRKFFRIQEDTVSKHSVNVLLLLLLPFTRLPYNLLALFSSFSNYPQVCRNCILRQSCKYVNQGVWNGSDKNLNLTVVMQVITQYTLEATPKQLVIPEDLKASVSRLLNEILKLSPTVSRN